MNRVLNLGLFFAGLLLVSRPDASAQEWTRFRGPNGTGESETTTIPATWTAEDYHWKVKLPGVGHSSPVLWGDRLFVLSADPETALRYVLCYDARTGGLLWEKSFESAPYRVHAQNSYASSSPAVDADRVYVAWATSASVTLMALTHQGDVVWQNDLGTWSSLNGFGTSPIVVEDLVILSNSQESKGAAAGAPVPESVVLAFERATGKERWRTARKTVHTSYAVPAIFQPTKGPAQLVSTSTGEGLFALDPRTGDELWSNPLFDKRTVSSPLVKQDLIIGSTGSGGGGNYLVAARSDGTTPVPAYKIDTQAPYVPMSVARGDLLFLVSDGGIASCLDLASGNVHWRKRIGGNYSSSLVRANDKLYCTSMDGEVVVLAADHDFEELGRVPLGEGSRATPAIANGRMFLRTYSQLMAIGGPKQATVNP